jgi:hypothetical protein
MGHQPAIKRITETYVQNSVSDTVRRGGRSELDPHPVCCPRAPRSSPGRCILEKAQDVLRVLLGAGIPVEKEMKLPKHASWPNYEEALPFVPQALLRAVGPRHLSCAADRAALCGFPVVRYDTG